MIGDNDNLIKKNRQDHTEHQYTWNTLMEATLIVYHQLPMQDEPTNVKEQLTKIVNTTY